MLTSNGGACVLHFGHSLVDHLADLGFSSRSASGRAKSRKRVTSALVRSTSLEMNPASSCDTALSAFDVLQQHLGRSFDRAQRIPNLVRQARRKLAQRGQPLVAPRPSLRPPANCDSLPPTARPRSALSALAAPIGLQQLIGQEARDRKGRFPQEEHAASRSRTIPAEGSAASER